MIYRIMILLTLAIASPSSLACAPRLIHGLVDIPLPPNVTDHFGRPSSSITCHKSMKAPLESVFRCLAVHDTTLLRSVNGCYCYRNIRDTDRLSNHAHGTAIDINARWNGYGQPSTQSPILVWCFKQAGFLWGGDWKTPDAMHFELKGN